MTRAELMQMAQASGLPFRQLEDRYCDLADLPNGSICRISDVSIDGIERFANAVLERAAAEANDVRIMTYATEFHKRQVSEARETICTAIRALKINTEEEPTA